VAQGIVPEFKPLYCKKKRIWTATSLNCEDELKIDLEPRALSIVFANACEC
jgi:hypothetical protein